MISVSVGDQHVLITCLDENGRSICNYSLSPDTAFKVANLIGVAAELVEDDCEDEPPESDGAPLDSVH